MIEFEDFGKVDIRVRRVVKVDDFPEARKPSYKLLIDFGDKVGEKKSIAQLVSNYTKEDLLNRFVHCVFNFPPRQNTSYKIRSANFRTS